MNRPTNARPGRPSNVPAKYVCALCATDIASETPRRAPLGKGGALVNVCDECDTAPAAELRSETVVRGYVPAGGHLKAHELDAAMRKQIPAADLERLTNLDSGIAVMPRASPDDVAYEEFRRETARRIRTGSNNANLVRKSAQWASRVESAKRGGRATARITRSKSK